ncbi:hypothetical protein CC80DRAFT_527091 [Byssothecium circinans]|uniref:Uncharacterized protein n=1 Tax=Byssothecium circinans TaxID=147558 RepID=A0A6A5TN89_9PLEO|nr:hypothetical protein CC80DRAFT_527091 [Byssothecium circinans]
MDTPVSMETRQSPHGIPRKPLPVLDPSKAKSRRSFASLACVAATLLAATVFSWRWIISGTPILLSSLFLAEWNDRRVIPWLPLWAIFTTLNFAYVVAATSWLLYWIFTSACYCAILLSSLYQFEFAARFARHRGRKLLRHVLFIQDRVGLFDLPALEIDTDTIGLFVVRGLTISLSSLTATAYGVEVGIKLDNDMELAIQTDKVVVKLFRRIEMGNVYANVKGSDEMSFGEIESWPNPRDMSMDQFVAVDTPILKAAMDSRRKAPSSMQDQLDGLTEIEFSNKPVKKLSPDDEKARTEHDWMINRIMESTSSSIASRWLKKIAKEREIDGVLETETRLRAAISAHIHEDPTIAHPPRKSIRLTTLRHNYHPKIKKFLHRLPLLYRMILNPISYFHPIFINSVTSTGSGKWFVSLMKKHFFKHYSSSDAEVRRLEGRISAWLADANFAVGFNNLYCTGNVPMDTDYEIECKFKIGDMMAHRALPEAVGLTQVIHLGGADATFVLPSFLLPHHEHLMPSILTDFEEMQMEQQVEEAKGTPQAVQLRKELERRRKDETAMKISVHGHLPFLFDQELLNFVAATVKATKVIEVEKGHEELVLKRAATDKLELEIRNADSIASDSIASETLSTGSAEDDDNSGDSDKTDPASTVSQVSTPRNSTFGARMGQTFKGMNTKMKEGWRKAGINTVNVVANDRWIAKIVGNIMRKLEKAQGDVGYSGLIALPLAPYRERAELESKLLK